MGKKNRADKATREKQDGRKTERGNKGITGRIFRSRTAKDIKRTGVLGEASLLGGLVITVDLDKGNFVRNSQMGLV